MFRFVTLGLALCLSTAASAQVPGQLTIINPPGWTYPGAAFDCDFVNQRYYNCQLPQSAPLTRAAVRNAALASGTYVQFPSGAYAITDQGLAIWYGGSNSALWARDMTQASWVAVNITPALNAVGVDGTSNSASTLTASAGNATILQTVVHASSSDAYSVFLKQTTGSGAIQLTLDGTTFTTCGSLTSTTFTRCFITQASVVNPVVGLRIVTSGDVVIADVNQLDAATTLTSAVTYTTTVSVTGAQDAITLGGRLFNIMDNNIGSMISETGLMVSISGAPGIIGTSDANNYPMRVTAGTLSRFKANNVDTNATPGSALSYLVNTIKTGISWDTAGESIVAANGTLVTASNVYTPPATLNLGCVSSASGQCVNGFYRRITGWGNRLLDATLKSLTTP